MEVVGIELAGQSAVYEWVPETGQRFNKITLFQGQAIEEAGFISRFVRTFRACFSQGSGASYFMCNYEHPATLFAAVLLRLCGRQVFAVGCSKYDDYPRHLWREVLKSILYLPYSGGLASGTRSVDYMRFLGFAGKKIQPNYNAVSIARIRKLAEAQPAPEGLPHRERHFVLVARFVPKKNVRMAIEAFAIYAARSASPRMLHLLGSGPLEGELRSQVQELGIQHLVQFRGFLQTADVCKTLASSLVLLLPSIEEQFGNVIPEALAMGVPVILSDNCGARDLLVRTGVNGFVVEPDNPHGMALFMKMLADNEELWRSMCLEALKYSEKGDAERFAESVNALIGTATESMRGRHSSPVGSHS